MNFIARGLKGIKLMQASGTSSAHVVFTRDVLSPCTVSTALPFTAPGKHAFEVAMPIKQARTAIGFCANTPIATYLTPSFTPAISGSSGGYVSMGGAGFIYPEATASGSRYGEGDTIRCELDFDAKTVLFFVNGARAGAAVAWLHGNTAYPSISSEGGTVDFTVTF